jgi:hypothetical protein
VLLISIFYGVFDGSILNREGLFLSAASSYQVLSGYSKLRECTKMKVNQGNQNPFDQMTYN